MSYIKDDFLLDNEYAVTLYEQAARQMPIFDYHCHLSETELAADRRFDNIHSLWLKGDHYKWRLMRNYGVSERLITGDAPPYDKFCAYVEAVSTAYGNPLYHWSAIELKEYFDCDLELHPRNARDIWEICNAKIADKFMTPSSVLRRSDVKHLFTTNEITDDLSVFGELKARFDDFDVMPAFRADKLLNIDLPTFNDGIRRLGAMTSAITDIDSLQAAVASRLEDFCKAGARAADISLKQVYPVSLRSEADSVLRSVLAGKTPDERDISLYKGYMTYMLIGMYASVGLRVQLHIGALRNNNSLMYEALGPDTGFDSISDADSTDMLARLMDRLNREGSLPGLVLFNLNPRQNLEFLTLAGCFQDDSLKGKIQYGPAWWFLDHKAGMLRHLTDLSSVGHLGTFIGMLTDSRSFLSYPRHHYFRRILCSYLGNLMAKGEMTTDIEAVKQVVRDICYNNAAGYFGIN